eukprot:TRINITY_DN9733_c0_g1_i1.p1 TRINITY_DN9733_c0_g1~~TRINITY_DN9733_c0_g1_i1.p1  ORF type:complete len:315 (+),score=40.63 TRINITY_DN9733_c0_g1_i1:43-987(+)
MTSLTESESMATLVSRVGMVGCAYLGFRFVKSCLKGREENRLTDGVVFGTKVYLKTATGAAAVLAGSKLWGLLPRVVPSGVVMLLTPLPFAVHALKCKETLFTSLRNNEFGMLPLAGFTLFGYSCGRIISLISSLGFTKPIVLVTYSLLFGHIVAMNIGESVQEILLLCAPASICITAALAPGVIGLQKFASAGEMMLQGQVLLSAMLAGHTWWSVELGDPLQFDINNHAIIVTGCGLYTGWLLIRVFFRVADRTVLRKKFKSVCPEKLKGSFLEKNLANIMSTVVLAAGFIILESVVGRVLIKKESISYQLVD